jgi:hypothetical protein
VVVGVALGGAGVGVVGVGVGVVGVGVGVAVVGLGAGVVALGVGVVLVAVGVGVDFVRAGLADEVAAVRVDAFAVGCAGALAVALAGAAHDTEYAAGLDAAAEGLVTTSTASPVAGNDGGVIVSGVTAFVPGALKATVPAAEFCPLPSAQ